MRASRVNPTCVDPAKDVRSATLTSAPSRRVAPGSRLSLRSAGTRGWRKWLDTLPNRRAEARARPGHERVAADAMAFEPLADAPPTSFPFHNVKQRSLLRSRDIFCARVLFPFPSFSASDPRPRGGGAPGGGILYPVAPVTTRRHVCEAWAVPRNRDGASRRSTVTVLGPLRALVSGVASGSLARATLASRVWLPVGQGSRTSRARLTNRGRDATSRSTFKKRF